ncbi:MAG: RNA polymerase sigma factor [Solirubrobacteraceae bacterium]
MAPQTLDVAALYAARAGWMTRWVRYQLGAPEPLVEDACQAAWSRLLDHHDQIAPEAALVWLVRTAEREALRLGRRAGRELPLDALSDHRRELRRIDGGPSPDELAEQHARLASVRTLPVRQRRLLWLRGLGFSYIEIAACTGLTIRTVERQLHRARRRLAAQ